MAGWTPEQVDELWNKSIGDIEDPGLKEKLKAMQEAVISYGIKSFKPMGASSMTFGGGVYTAGADYAAGASSTSLPYRNKFSLAFNRIWERMENNNRGAQGMSAVHYYSAATPGASWVSPPMGGSVGPSYTVTSGISSAPSQPMSATQYALQAQSISGGTLTQAHLDKIASAFAEGQQAVASAQAKSNWQVNASLARVKNYFSGGSSA